jgi:hypothetical protein
MSDPQLVMKLPCCRIFDRFEAERIIIIVLCVSSSTDDNPCYGIPSRIKVLQNLLIGTTEVKKANLAHRSNILNSINFSFHKLVYRTRKGGSRRRNKKWPLRRMMMTIMQPHLLFYNNLISKKPNYRFLSINQLL